MHAISSYRGQLARSVTIARKLLLLHGRLELTLVVNTGLLFLRHLTTR